MSHPVIDPSAATAPLGSLFRVDRGRLVPWPSWAAAPVGNAYVLQRRWTVERAQFTAPPSRVWRCESCGGSWDYRPERDDCACCGGEIEAHWLSHHELVSTLHVAFHGGACRVCGKPLSLHRVVGEALDKPIPKRCPKHAAKAKAKAKAMAAREAARRRAEREAERQELAAANAARKAAYLEKWLAWQFDELVGEPEPRLPTRRRSLATGRGKRGAIFSGDGLASPRNSP